MGSQPEKTTGQENVCPPRLKYFVCIDIGYMVGKMNSQMELESMKYEERTNFLDKKNKFSVDSEDAAIFSLEEAEKIVKYLNEIQGQNHYIRGSLT